MSEVTDATTPTTIDTSTYGEAATTTPTPAPTTTPQLSELEQVATDMGWNPDKDTLGEQWVDAKTFIKRTRDIQNTQSRTIKDQSRKLDRIVSTVDTLRQHYEKVAEAQQREYDAKIVALKAERRVAIAENDPAKVDDLDTQIDDLKVAKVKAASTPQPSATNDPMLQEWSDENDGWYGKDRELTAYAHKRARLYRINDIADDGLYRETLDEIAREVKAAFPAKFGGKTPRSPTPASADGVEGVVRPGPIGGSTSNKRFTVSSLNVEQRKVHDAFVNDLGLKSEDIINDWVKIGELT